MPIQNGKYINPGWLDNGPPAIDAAEMNAISDTLENLDAGGGSGGDGKRYARIVIGTSTNGWTAEDCDYLCDGTDDEVEIQAAAQQLPDYIGGEIVLLDGTYNIGTYVSFKTKTTVSGTGRSAVSLKRTGTSGSGVVAAMMVLPNDCQLRNLTIDGSSSIWGSGDWSRVCDVLAGGGTNITNVDFYNSINESIYAEPVTGRSMIIDGCYFQIFKTAIHADCNGELIVSNCGFWGSLNSYMIRGIGIMQNNNHESPLQDRLSIKMVNCVDRVSLSDIFLDGTGFSTITNCHCHSITLQMTQEEGPVKPERGRHILIGNVLCPSNNQDAVLTIGEGVNNCIAIGNIISVGSTVGTIQDNGENNIIYNGTSGGQVTLTTSGWSSNQQTVTAPGVTTNNYVTTGPTPATFNAAMEAGVYCSGQGNGTLTFTCTTTPSSSITYTYTAQEVL